MFFVKTILNLSSSAVARRPGWRRTSTAHARQRPSAGLAGGRNAGEGWKLPIRLGCSDESATAGAAGSPDLVSRQQYVSENFSAQRDRVGASGSIAEWKVLNIHCMATSIGS